MKPIGVVTFLLALSSHLTVAGPLVEREFDQRPVTRIAFGSCANHEKPQPIWKAIDRWRPDVFVFLGDNVYGDTEDMEVLASKYAALGAKPGYKAMQKHTAVIATWDDHDYGANDAGLEYPKKAESKEVFLEFFTKGADDDKQVLRSVLRNNLPVWKRER